MVKQLTRKEGLFIGISAGAAVAACVQVATRDKTGLIVTILCDDGSKYLSEKFWHED
jgi:cysteine synthase B